MVIYSFQMQFLIKQKQQQQINLVQKGGVEVAHHPRYLKLGKKEALVRVNVCSFIYFKLHSWVQLYPESSCRHILCFCVKIITINSIHLFRMNFSDSVTVKSNFTVTSFESSSLDIAYSGPSFYLENTTDFTNLFMSATFLLMMQKAVFFWRLLKKFIGSHGIYSLGSILQTLTN